MKSVNKLFISFFIGIISANREKRNYDFNEKLIKRYRSFRIASGG